ncbi:hypothetical protein BH09SUM1_BH09SUM1_05940 [soil metagenome]
MTDDIRLLQSVAITVDKPAHGLVRGQVGTVVEELAPGVFEVEFSDQSGKAYAFAPVRQAEMIVLHHDPVRAAG